MTADGPLRWSIAQYLQTWIDAVELQSARATDIDLESGRRETEVHFYAIALHNLWRGAKWAERELEAGEQLVVVNALSRFRQTAYDARNVRGVLEHTIAYDTGIDIGGRSKHLASVPSPNFPRWWEADENETAINISSSRKRGPYRLEVRSSARAARALADAVLAAVKSPLSLQST